MCLPVYLAFLFSQVFMSTIKHYYRYDSQHYSDVNYNLTFFKIFYTGIIHLIGFSFLSCLCSYDTLHVQILQNIQKNLQSLDLSWITS